MESPRIQLFHNFKLVTPLTGRAWAVEHIDEGALLVNNGRVQQYGCLADLRDRELSAEWVDLGGGLMTPGLVDAHTHAAFAGNRADEFFDRCQGESYAEIKARGGGIQRSIQSVQEATDDQLQVAIRRNLSWAMRSGVVGLEIKSGYGQTQDHELRQLRLAHQAAKDMGLRHSRTLLAFHALPTGSGSMNAYVQESLNWLQDPKHRDEFECVDMFIEQGYFTPEHARLVAHQFPESKRLRLHVDQFSDQGGAELAAELGAISADHLEYSKEEAGKFLAESGVFPVLLPLSVLGLRSHKYPDARAMIGHGARVVVATDFNPGSSPSPSLLLAGSLACLWMSMSPEEILVSMTLHAAEAALLNHDLGTLETGKAASFAVWDVSTLEELYYWVGAPLLKALYIDGERKI